MHPPHAPGWERSFFLDFLAVTQFNLTSALTYLEIVPVCTASPQLEISPELVMVRPSNLQRSKWREKCRQKLAQHVGELTT